MIDERTLAETLDAVDPALTPPPLLDAVYAVPTDRPSRWNLAGVAALLAAAVILWVLWPSAPAPMSLAMRTGDSVLEGHLLVHTPGASVTLNGRARISLEPTTPSLRVPQHQQEVPMKVRDLVAGTAGVALTITVYEGSALVYADAGSPVEVVAGEQRRFEGTPDTPDQPSVAAPAGTHVDPTIARLQAELAAAKKELATERFAGAITRGQLTAEAGEPIAWPAEVPATFTEGQFERKLLEQLQDTPDVELTSVDCSEFPCMATLRYTGDSTEMDWGKPTMDAIMPWVDDSWADATVSANNSHFRTDDHSERFITFGVYGERDPITDDRLKWRMDQSVSNLSDDLDAGLFDPK